MFESGSWNSNLQPFNKCSLPNRDMAVLDSWNVTKPNDLNGFGMKTSVTGPNFSKCSLRSSVVIVAESLATNIFEDAATLKAS